MKVAVLQVKPKLCLNKKEFYSTIDNLIQTTVSKHNPDLILFPESLGLWMSMMRPIGFLSKLANFILPSHKILAHQIFTSNLKKKNSMYEILTKIQFSKTPEYDSVSTKNLENRNLLYWKEYNQTLGIIAIKGKNDIRIFLMKISDWIFNRLNMGFIGRLLRSKEQLKIYIQTFSSISKKYSINIQAGSIFTQNKFGGIKNIAYTFNKNGDIISQQPKIHPISFENMIGIIAGKGEDVFEVNGIKCGVAICADVNFPYDHVSRLKEKGCKLVACPSGGIVPSHSWKWNFETEIKNAHWARSQEENIIIARTYNAGDLIPGVLMFQGRSSATAHCQITKNRDGVLYLVPQKDLVKEHTFCIEIV